MSTTPVQSGTPLQDLARAILGSFDANKDGNLSADEFTSFLSRLLGTTSTSAAATNLTSSTSSTISLAAAATAAATPSYEGLPRSPMEGFDFAKIRNLSHQSLKYKFARVAWNYDVLSVKDKAGAESLLNSMVSDLKAAGVNVIKVKGDTITIRDGNEEFTVDVIRGASSGSPAWQWLDLRYA